MKRELLSISRSALYVSESRHNNTRNKHVYCNPFLYRSGRGVVLEWIPLLDYQGPVPGMTSFG